jgi:hypothetical protein
MNSLLCFQNSTLTARARVHDFVEGGAGAVDVGVAAAAAAAVVLKRSLLSQYSPLTQSDLPSSLVS